jgi:hypothetical protein
MMLSIVFISHISTDIERSHCHRHSAWTTHLLFSMSKPNSNYGVLELQNYGVLAVT